MNHRITMDTASSSPPPAGPPVPPSGAAGFDELGAGSPQRATRFHAYLAIAAFGVYTLSTAAFAWFARSRTIAWTEAVHRRATVAAAHDADQTYVLAARSTWVTMIVGAVAVSVWAGRVVANARTRGMLVSPRRAGWCWLIRCSGAPEHRRVAPGCVRDGLLASSSPSVDRGAVRSDADVPLLLPRSWHGEHDDTRGARRTCREWLSQHCCSWPIRTTTVLGREGDPSTPTRPSRCDSRPPDLTSRQSGRGSWAAMWHT